MLGKFIDRGLLCLRKILQKLTDCVPQQDCKTNQGAKINLALAILIVIVISPKFIEILS